MMGQEAAKEYRKTERSDTWTAENLKSEYAYADICVQYVVGLAYRCDCMDSARSVQRWTLGIDRRRCDAMARDPMREGKELPGSASRISDSTRA